jgi:phosphoribosylformylglycinamidine (FGAM) synthase-like enzyme
MGVVGILKTAAPLTIDFKKAGRAVVLLGGIGPADEVRFGGTQYAKNVLDDLWGLPPALDLEYEKRVQSAAREIAQSGLAESAHDLSDGGLAVALAESSFGPAGIGAEIDLDSDLRPELLLFHEGPSRVLVSTAEPERIIEIAARHAVEAIRIGSTVKDRLLITSEGAERRPLIQADIGTLKDGWEKALENYVR